MRKHLGSIKASCAEGRCELYADYSRKDHRYHVIAVNPDASEDACEADAASLPELVRVVTYVWGDTPWDLKLAPSAQSILDRANAHRLTGEDIARITLRLPEDVYDTIFRLATQRSMSAGKHVSQNSVIVELIEAGLRVVKGGGEK